MHDPITLSLHLLYQPCCESTLCCILLFLAKHFLWEFSHDHLIPELTPFFVTTKTEIAVLPSILHFLSAQTRYFVGKQETLALITVLKIEWHGKGLTLYYSMEYGGSWSGGFLTYVRCLTIADKIKTSLNPFHLVFSARNLLSYKKERFITKMISWRNWVTLCYLYNWL